MRVLTIDLEYDWETDKSDNITEIVPKLLDFLKERQVTATFFTLASLAEEHEDLIKEISQKHEIASHSFSHSYLNQLNEEHLDEEIRKSKKTFEKLKIKVKGFRAPYFVVPEKFGTLLKKHGFAYDSSIASFFPFRYSNVLSPKKPYMASAGDISRRGNDIMEMPVPDFTPLRFPSAGFSYFRLFYPFSARFFRKPYMLYLHPCEFLRKKPSKNISPIVRKLYGINRGEKAWKILDGLVKEKEFISCREFLQKEGMINE